MSRRVTDMDSPAEEYGFEDVWPRIAKHLDSVLRNRCIDQGLREDLIQDTAVRLLQAWDGLDLSRPVDGLAVTIATNLMRDHFRRRSNQEIVGEIPERPSDLDVERLGMARSELHRVGRAMTKLSPDHRMVLLGEISDGRPSRDRGAAATKMLRMRARRRLTAILETASGFVVGLNDRFRRDLFTEQGARMMAAALVMAAAGPAAGIPASTSQPTLVAHAIREPSEGDGARGKSQAPYRSRVSDRRTSLSPAAPPPATSARQAAPQRRLRPLALPFGDSEATIKARVEVYDMTVGIGEYGGPAPVCVSGVPGTPEPTDCPEEDEPAAGESDETDRRP